MFRLAYNTNGLVHHRLPDALRMLAELGYEGVALTPDAGSLDPLAPAPGSVAEVRRLSEELSLSLAVETGARFLLDPRRKHRPSLLEDEPAERRRRVDFLRRCVDLAAELGAEVVSLWAGRAPGDARGDAPGGGERAERAWERLAAGVEAVLDHASGSGVAVAFEPEPGMFVERPAGYDELVARLGAAGERLGLCLDVGHLLCTGDLPVPDVVRRYGPRLAQVHLDDVRGAVHEHLMLGEGELDLVGTLAALIEVGYAGQAAVELSRDSHRGAEAAALAMERLRAALGRRG